MAAPTFWFLTPTTGSVFGGEALLGIAQECGTSISITLDGVSCTINGSYAGRIRFQVPAHAAGAVNLVYTDSNGTFTSTGIYTYTATGYKRFYLTALSVNNPSINFPRPSAKQCAATISLGYSMGYNNFTVLSPDKPPGSATVGRQTVINPYAYDATAGRFYGIDGFPSTKLIGITSIAAGTWIFATSIYTYVANGYENHDKLCIYVWRPSNSTKVGTIFEGTADYVHPDGAGFGMFQTLWLKWTMAGLAVTGIQDGDILCLEWLACADASHGEGGHYAYYNGNTDPGADRVSSGSYNQAATYLEAPVNLWPIQGQTRNLTTVCAAISAGSTPLVAITRPLTSSPAAVSTVSSPLLAITRALQASVAAGSATSAPLLAVLRALASSAVGVSDTGAPALAVERSLSASPAAVSAVTTPNLVVQRDLAALAVVMSETSDISLRTNAIHDLVTAIAVKSQTNLIPIENEDIASGGSWINLSNLPIEPGSLTVELFFNQFGYNQVNYYVDQGDGTLNNHGYPFGTINYITGEINFTDYHPWWNIQHIFCSYNQVHLQELNVVRSISNVVNIQTQTSASLLTVLRDLITTIASETQTPDLMLKVYRDLMTAISGQSAVSTPVLDLFCFLVTATAITTDTSAPTLAVLRDLMATIAAQTVVPDFDLELGVPRHLVTIIAAITRTSDIEVILAFHESLLAKAKRFYGPISANDLKVAALEWLPEEEEKEANLPGQEYDA